MPIARFARYTHRLGASDLPPEVRHAARRCLVDWFSAVIPGGTRPPATVLVAALTDELDLGGACLYPSGRRATLRAAALINGCAAHALEFDDIYRDALYHPGAPVISAALAAAQGQRTGGDRLLRGIIAGYEVSNRIGRTANPAHYAFWHTTGTVGTFGAAAAAGAVLGLSEDQIGHALANAATMAAGLQQAFRSDAMSKPLHAGRAAEGGLLAALGAGRGMTGARDMLSGERGFGAAMCGAPDWSRAVADLDDRFTILDTTQKNHGCCGHTFAALDGVVALRNAHRLSPADVERLRVGTYATALEVTGNAEPATATEARFSLPYCAAVALKDGRVRLDAFDAAHLADGEVRELAGRIELFVDADAERAFPGRRSAVVEITTRGGAALRHRAETRKGDPENPLSDAELVDKYRELVAPVIGEGTSETLLDALWRIDELDNLGRLRGTTPTRAMAGTV